MLKKIYKLGELALMNNYKKLEREKHTLIDLFWECTLTCNAKCKHCGSSAEKRKYEQEKYVVIKSNIGVHKIMLSNIICVEAQKHHVIYHLKNDEKIECTDKFSNVCEFLLNNHEFILVHRSFLVNMNYIRHINATDIYMQNSLIIPLAQRRVADIKRHYLAFQMED